MPKYRYGDPIKGGIWKRRLSVVAFVCAWNAFALAAYGWYKTRNVDNPETAHMNSTQKYMYYINTGGEKVKYVKFSGLTKVDSKVITKEEALGMDMRQGAKANEQTTETTYAI